MTELRKEFDIVLKDNIVNLDDRPKPNPVICMRIRICMKIWKRISSTEK